MGVNFTMRDLEEAGVMPDAHPVDEAAKGLLLRLTESELSLLTALYQAGEEGISAAQLKKLEKKYPDAALAIETMGFVDWLKTMRGKPVAMTLTWKGSDLMESFIKLGRMQARN
jgi:hypothetical protein